jgi:tetratricopeptide (TPR) repeat protein
MYEQMKNFKIALVYYDKLEKVNNKHKSLYYNRGWVKSELNEMPGAIADYTKCIEMQPNHFRAIFNRGKIYMASNEFAKAENDFDAFIKLMPGYGPAYYNRAVVKYYLNKKEDACKDAEIGKSIGDKSCIEYLQKYCK